MVRGGRAEAPPRRSDVSFRLDQKTGSFKAAFFSRQMQWSLLPEGKQKESTCAYRVSLHEDYNNNNKNNNNNINNKGGGNYM
jgi:hypothetical protein